MPSSAIIVPREADRRLAATSPELDAVRGWIDRHHGAHAIVVALSRFDIVNAAWGRPAGDALLATARARIRSVVPGAAVARMAGATFLVAAPGDVTTMAGRVVEALARPFPVGDSHAALGARVGVASRAAGDDAEALIARGIEALADIRDDATVRVADADAVAPIETLAVDLHRAIERDEIALLFQPQVRIADDWITGAEALARWDHPVLGSLGADLLFAAADRADLGLALSDHIQGLALRTAAAWPAVLAGLDLSINVTAGDIARAGFATALLARIVASGLAPARLTVEITETALITDLAGAGRALERLRAAGVRVAIDDFGTGYAGFAYLKTLPLDRLKLDRSLIGDVATSPRGRAVVRGVVALAHALDLVVVAEGVETVAQRDALAVEGCGWYQGFLCAGALDTPALARLIEDRE